MYVHILTIAQQRTKLQNLQSASQYTCTKKTSKLLYATK